MDFTATVKERMKEQGVSVATLSQRIGFGAPYIYSLLSRRKRWNETTMNRVCEALGLKVDFIPESTGQDAANQ